MARLHTVIHVIVIVTRNKTQLEIWGRAQHEATRRPKSDLKYILGSCKVCKNLRGQHALGPKYSLPKKSKGWVNMNFLVSGPKFTNVVLPNRG